MPLLRISIRLLEGRIQDLFNETFCSFQEVRSYLIKKQSLFDPLGVHRMRVRATWSPEFIVEEEVLVTCIGGELFEDCMLDLNYMIARELAHRKDHAWVESARASASACLDCCDFELTKEQMETLKIDQIAL